MILVHRQLQNLLDLNKFGKFRKMWLTFHKRDLLIENFGIRKLENQNKIFRIEQK
jgi:hypothetical protein